MGSRKEIVVLVHGLWMHGVVFRLLRRRLARDGFATTTWSYPSVRTGLAANALALSDFLRSIDADTIHVVGHSLGGIVTLSALSAHRDPRVHRVVLMGSPNRGSLSGHTIMRMPGLCALVGESMREWLGTTTAQKLDGLELGVIAGSRSIGLVGTLVKLPTPNDGVVTVDEARHEFANDTITLPVNHTEMLFSRSCADQVAAFLRTGHFEHAAEPQKVATH